MAKTLLARQNKNIRHLKTKLKYVLEQKIMIQSKWKHVQVHLWKKRQLDLEKEIHLRWHTKENKPLLRKRQPKCTLNGN